MIMPLQIILSLCVMAVLCMQAADVGSAAAAQLDMKVDCCKPHNPAAV